MTPRVTNNDINLHDEEFNGQEVEAAALPPPTEMAVNHNHPEEEEPEDEPEPTSGRSNRYRFSRNQALAALVAVALVGTVAVISRARARASGKTSISSSMQQAANVPQDLGYELVEEGTCVDASNNNYPVIVYAGPYAVDACANKCKDCVEGAVPYTFVGMHHEPTSACICLVSAPVNSADFDQFNSDGPCKATATVTTYIGTGPIMGTDTQAKGFTCYKYVGGGGGGGDSKASKTPKAAKRG